jgi:hypothetical protein
VVEFTPPGETATAPDAVVEGVVNPEAVFAPAEGDSVVKVESYSDSEPLNLWQDPNDAEVMSFDDPRLIPEDD